jgi:choline dehydrogenase-like flavoprotein
VEQGARAVEEAHVAERDYDVVIVGAGFSGSILAHQAAVEGGLDVLVLEAGTDLARTYTGYQTQLQTFYDAFYKTPESPWAYNPNAPEPDIPGVPTKGADYFIERGIPYGSTYARALGGTSLHWMGTCLRMLPEDFDFRTRFGRGRDWPIGYDDLAPDYERAEWEIGVSADVEDQEYLEVAFRDGYDYPMRRIPPSYSDQRLGDAVNGMTVEVGGERRELLVRSTPAGRNSDPRGGYEPVGAVDHSRGFRPPGKGQGLARDIGERCQGNSSCVPICPVQAKYNALKTLSKATATGRVTVLPRAVAARVLVEGRRVTGIEYLRYRSPDSPAHTTEVARGRTYVLACHAVENAKLMLMSGLQTPSELVGANLHDHPTLLTWGLAPEQAGAYRGPLSTAGIEDLRGGAFRSRHAAFRIEVGNDGWTWPAGAPDTTVNEALADGLIGAALRERLRDVVGRHLRFGSLIEQPPDPANRVTIDPSQRDPLGLPRPVIEYGVDAYVLDGMAVAREVAREVFAQAGIQDCTDPAKAYAFKAPWAGQTLVWAGAGHFAGTHCMGADPETSVVDSHQRSWRHDNLFVAGPGSMPCMGTSNPTLTVSALAFRTSRELIANPDERGGGSA